MAQIGSIKQQLLLNINTSIDVIECVLSDMFDESYKLLLLKKEKERLYEELKKIKNLKEIT